MVSSSTSAIASRYALIQSLQFAYQQADKDGNGSLSRSEYASSGKLSPVNGKEAFNNLDTNKDGSLSESEYIAGFFRSLRGDIEADDQTSQQEKSELLRRISSTKQFLIQALQADEAQNKDANDKAEREGILASVKNKAA